MFLMQKSTHSLVEVLAMPDLFDPFIPMVMAQSHSGEELQDAEEFPKADLMFPSGEPLPRCWIDPDYRGLHMRPAALVAL